MLTNAFKDKVQLVVYLAEKYGGKGLSVIKAVKLIFLADVWALRHYADTVSEDEYFAMKNGPVPSTIATIIQQDDEYLESKEQLEYIREYLKREDGNTWTIFRAQKPADRDHLSEVQKEAVDLIYNQYGDKTERELIAITHTFEAWRKPGEKLNEENRREKMDMEDILKNDGVLTADKDRIATTRRLYGRV